MFFSFFHEVSTGTVALLILNFISEQLRTFDYVPLGDPDFLKCLQKNYLVSWIGEHPYITKLF